MKVFGKENSTLKMTRRAGKRPHIITHYNRALPKMKWFEISATIVGSIDLPSHPEQFLAMQRFLQQLYCFHQTNIAVEAIFC